MEYPTLITVGTAWWLPEGLRFPEFVAVHEFGHQYWYGMVASNEFEEAWLDEGVNSYVEGRIMDDLYGPDSYVKLLGLGLGSLAEQRLRYIIAPQHDPMVRDGWQFLDRSSYRSITYSKTALVLRTLDGHLGGDRVRDALATYFKRWQFRHPHGSDLLAAINEVAGQDLGWYFEQVVTGTGVLDYAVTQVDAEEVYGFAGLRLSEPTGEMVAPEKLEPRQYRSQVVVERLGAVHMPVDVQVVFEDATAVTEHWDGRDRWKRFEYTGPQRVEWAVVDPKGTMPLDVDQLNNARMRESGTRGIVRVAGRWSFWFQNLVYFISAL